MQFKLCGKKRTWGTTEAKIWSHAHFLATVNSGPEQAGQFIFNYQQRSQQNTVELWSHSWLKTESVDPSVFPGGPLQQAWPWHTATHSHSCRHCRESIRWTVRWIVRRSRSQTRWRVGQEEFTTTVSLSLLTPEPWPGAHEHWHRGGPSHLRKCRGQRLFIFHE